MLIIQLENEDKEFDNFKSAIDFCEDEFGFEGQAWDEVVNSLSMSELFYFLEDDGVWVIHKP
ncbi:hypothetical protein [Paenibacillus silvae]|uniref:Uncharacterized protein n=1 Tax=Paenibacillus silvae TaxID=1325358 RepID=A0A2W6NNA5_9BACL|nr:hypothetical protein [Paenibacillus silvae]PZT57344.1 hypothetical protein DN757_01420 [Paenibacillus silvae]